MLQKAMMNLSYTNNIGVRLARWERDSDSERATQKGSTRYECMCASVRSSDYRTFVCAMRIDVMSYINNISHIACICICICMCQINNSR